MKMKSIMTVSAAEWPVGECGCRRRLGDFKVWRMMKYLRRLSAAPASVFLCFLVCLCSCRTSPPARTVAAPFYAPKLAEMDAAIERAIEGKRCPGGVLWLEHPGVTYHKAYGHRALIPTEEPMTEDTIFDLASLTKVIACSPAVMLLIERGQVKLDEPVQTYIPEFKGEGTGAITVRQLMTHTSGLRGDVETRTD